jgi:hypothetical protein
MTSAPTDIKEKLNRARCTTPADLDERILTDAAAQLQRAAKVRARRSWWSVIAAAVAVSLLAAAVFLAGRGGLQQPARAPALPSQPAQEQPGQQSPPLTKHAAAAGNAIPPKERPKSKLASIQAMAAAGDVTGLAAILKTGDFPSKVQAVGFLLQMSDPRAAAALNDLAANLDTNDPQDQLLAKMLGVEEFGKPEEATEPNAPQPNAPEPNALEMQSKTEAVNEPNVAPAEQEKPAPQYATGWLTDVSGYVVVGKIHVGQTDVTTDGNGAFSIPRPSFQDFLSSFGWAVSDDGQLGAVFHWTADQDLNDMEIVCVDFASASGLVVDVNGAPVSGARMQIAPYVDGKPVDGAAELKGPWQITPAQGGAFDIASLPVGLPLTLLVSKGNLSGQAVIGAPAAGEHVPLGEIILQPPPVEPDSADTNTSGVDY